MVKPDTTRKLTLQPGCVIDLEPGLTCPETITHVVENLLNKVSVGCCSQHLNELLLEVGIDNVKVWPIQAWTAAGKT